MNPAEIQEAAYRPVQIFLKKCEEFCAAAEDGVGYIRRRQAHTEMLRFCKTWFLQWMFSKNVDLISVLKHWDKMCGEGTELINKFLPEEVERQELKTIWDEFCQNIRKDMDMVFGKKDGQENAFSAN